MTDETRFQRSDLDSNVPSLSLNVRIKSTEAIQNVLLTVHVNSPLCAHPNEIRLGQIGGSLFLNYCFIRLSLLVGNIAGTASIRFWMRDDLTPWNLNATFTISYNTLSDSQYRFRKCSFSIFLHSDVCHTNQKVHKLPLKLVARSVQQVPSSATAGQCKITLGTNKPVVDISTLFSGTKKQND